MSDRKVRQVKEEMVASPWRSTVQAAGDATVLPETGTAMARAWGALKKEVAEAWAACGAFEWWALGYLGVSSVLILVFAENLAHPFRLLCAEAAAATATLRARPRGLSGAAAASSRTAVLARSSISLWARSSSTVKCAAASASNGNCCNRRVQNA